MQVTNFTKVAVDAKIPIKDISKFQTCSPPQYPVQSNLYVLFTNFCFIFLFFVHKCVILIYHLLFHALGLIAVSSAWDTLRIGMGKTCKHSMKGTCLTTRNSWHTWWFLRIWLKLTMINFKQISVGGSCHWSCAFSVLLLGFHVKMAEKLLQNGCSG